MKQTVPQEKPRLNWKQRWLDFPNFPNEEVIEKQAKCSDASCRMLLDEFVDEGDRQTNRAAALFTAGAFIIATATIVRGVGLGRQEYRLVVFFAAVGIAFSFAAQQRRVGKLTIGVPATIQDVTESYSAVRKKAILLAIATIVVTSALFLVAIFVMVRA